MSGTGARRVAQACAVAAVAVPGVLLAHLFTTGLPAGSWPAAGAGLAVLLIGAARLVDGRLGLAVLTGSGQVAGHTVLALAAAAPSAQPACLPAVGRGASLGLRFAVLQADPACPHGTLAPGPTASVTVTAVGIAVAVLAGNAFIACLGGILLRTAGGVAGTARLVTGALARVTALPASLRALLTGVRLPVRRPLRHRPSRTADALPPPQWRPGALLLRGPPTTSTAIA